MTISATFNILARMKKPGRPRKNGRVIPSKGAATRLPVHVYYALKAEAEQCCKKMGTYLREVIRKARPDLPWGKK